MYNSKRINVPVQIRMYWWEKLPKINKSTGTFIRNSRVHVTRIFKPTKIYSCYRNSITKCTARFLQRDLKNRVRGNFALENRVI